MDNFNTLSLSQVNNISLENHHNYLLVVDQDNANINLNLETKKDESQLIIILDDKQNTNLSINHDINQGGYVKYIIVAQNSGVSKHAYDIHLGENNSECDFNLLSCLINAEFSVNANVYNLASRTTSNMHLRGVSENAKLTFNPVGKINKDCDKSTNFQSSRILVLDDNHNASINPVLLIDNYDVKAGHGATISKIDDNEKYYLMSRGIDEQVANQLLMIAFLKPILDLLPEELNKKILEQMENKLLKK